MRSCVLSRLFGNMEVEDCLCRILVQRLRSRLVYWLLIQARLEAIVHPWILTSACQKRQAVLQEISAMIQPLRQCAMRSLLFNCKELRAGTISDNTQHLPCPLPCAQHIYSRAIGLLNASACVMTCAREMLDSVGAPMSAMHSSSSVRMSSSTASTPCWPPSVRPHSTGRPSSTADAPSAKHLNTSDPRLQTI